MRAAPDSARSARRWAGCVTSSAIRRTPPSRVGISIGDSLAATFACVGALVGAATSRASGRGQVVDSAIYEAVLGMMESLITEYDQTGYIRERTGAILPNVAPSNVYPASDGLVLIAANQDTVFRRLCEAMGKPALADDARYASHQSRGAHQQELDELIGRWTAKQSTTAVLALMEQHGVPAGQIYRAPEMLEDPHFAAREAIVGVPHPQFGEAPHAERGAEAVRDARAHPLAVARARRAQRRGLPRLPRHAARALREAEVRPRHLNE